jgi:hypothetical protein
LKPDDLNLGVFFFTVFMTCILYKIITIYWSDYIYIYIFFLAFFFF